MKRTLEFTSARKSTRDEEREYKEFFRILSILICLAVAKEW